MVTKKVVKKTDSPVTPENPENYKKSIQLGKELSKNPDMTKAEVSRQMYDLIKDEKREVIAQAFVDGANLTPKGSMTYVETVN